MDSLSKSSEKPLIPFDQAPCWNQGIAEARADFLELADEFIKSHRTESGKTEMLNQFLKRFNQGLIAQEVRDRLRNNTITLSTYYQWRKDFDTKGLSGLLEGYGRKGCRIDSEIREAIEKMVWTDHLCQYQDVFEYLQFIFPHKSLPSYSTIRRYVQKYRTENWAALVYHHEGKKGLRDRGMEVALGRADEDLTEPNQKWEIDTTLADLFTGKEMQGVEITTQDGKRCKLIGVVDVFSRSLKFYLVEDESGFAVGKVIKDRILKWGLPGEIVIDNGKPFKNNKIKSFCRCVGIKLHICIPGHPEEKPHIERAFRTLSEKLFRRLCGYSGNSLTTRPKEIEFKYTQGECQEIIDDYIFNVYGENIHRSTGQRPRERMRPPGFTPKTIDERQLDLLLMDEHKRTVRKGHILFQGGRYFHPKLPEGQRVIVRVNDFDASELIVFVDEKFLCVAEDYRRRGKTPKDIKVARRERTQELRIRIKAHEALLDRDKPKDEDLLNLIRYNKESKPAELPQTAELIDFNEFKDIHYTGSKTETEGIEEIKTQANEEHEGKIYTSYIEKYEDLMRQKLRGEPLSDFDQAYLEEFREGHIYEMIGRDLDNHLKLEAINEG